jgi:hypothetical protein
VQLEAISTSAIERSKMLMHTKTPMNLENITSDTKSHLAYDSMYMKCPE